MPLPTSHVFIVPSSPTSGHRTLKLVGLIQREHASPIPPAWRAAAIAALDDNLDVTRVVEMMSELEGAEGVEPGAKFEAFAYLDRVLAVDLSRDLGRTRH